MPLIAVHVTTNGLMTEDHVGYAEAGYYILGLNLNAKKIFEKNPWLSI